MALTIGCYYFPNYHAGDVRNEALHGEGWNEWNLVKGSRSRFPGHRQPNLPLWGYGDESLPEVMAKKIDTAVKHGIDSFIFDWYYYDDGPFLETALEKGFLGVPKRDQLSFCSMWANHDWRDIHPCTRRGGREILYPGKVTRQTFERIAQIHIDRYFSCPGYMKVDGCPYFSVYDLNSLLQSFGSVAETAKALHDFRVSCRQAGYPGLHLNSVVWSAPVLPGETVKADLPTLLKELGMDSMTSYVWVHHYRLPKRQTPYLEVLEHYLDYWDQVRKNYDLEYFPNVSMGWDPSPRTVQSEGWDWEEGLAYPFGNLICDNTPENFSLALETVGRRLATSSQKHKIMTVNSWNEWTEGSYIEPDQSNGYAYLEAIKALKDTWA